jgi:hypothetical protein
VLRVLVDLWPALREGKLRAGADPDRVVWVSAATLARQWWCHAACVLEARELEPRVFRAWLADRMQAALAAGVVRVVPDSPDDILGVAFSPRVPEMEVPGGDDLLPCDLFPGRPGGGGPRRWARLEGLLVGAEPDGLEAGAVVQRCDAPGPGLARWALPVARCHADLCALVFGAGRRQVVTPEGAAEGPADRGAALEAVRVFLELESGKREPVPPAPWKCSDCEVWEDCPLAVAAGS